MALLLQTQVLSPKGVYYTSRSKLVGTPRTERGKKKLRWRVNRKSFSTVTALHMFQQFSEKHTLLIGFLPHSLILFPVLKERNIYTDVSFDKLPSRFPVIPAN